MVCSKLFVRKAFNPLRAFLKRIVTSNFRDMRNLMSVVFGLIKNAVLDFGCVRHDFKKCNSC